MRSFFRRLFHVYEGEERNATLFAFLGFLWAFGATAGLKFADALFLLHVGAASLPTTYIITASFMIVLAIFLLKAFDTINTHNIFITILSIGIIFYTAVYLCLTFGFGLNSHWLWYSLRIFGSMMFSIAITCYWTFVDQYYHLQDAKRLFSLFTSSIFLGVAATGFLMRSGAIDFQNVTLGIVALFLFAIIWIYKINQSIRPVYDEALIENRGEPEENSLRFLFQAILSSKFALLLMAGNLLIFLLQIITEYSYLTAFGQYFDSEHQAVIPGEEQTASLTMFLGKCLAGVSIFNLIFGLFFYGRFVRHFGVSNMVLLTPTVLVANYLGWNLSDALLFPVIAFFVVEGLLYIVDDNNFTLLLNAVPLRLKYRIRLIIESFFEPVGMLISSLMISLIPIDSRILGLIVASCALVIALFLRRQYLKAVIVTLNENAIHFQRTIKEWFSTLSNKKKKAVERRLLAIMQIGDEEAQMFALEGVLNIKDEAVLHKFIYFTDYLDDKGKIRALDLLSNTPFAHDPAVIKEIDEWLTQTPDSTLVNAIHFYQAKMGILPIEIAQRNLNSVDLISYGAAIIALSQQENYRQLATDHLENLLTSSEEQRTALGVEILGVIATANEISRFIPYLNSPWLKVARNAASAILRLASENNADYAATLSNLLQVISDSEMRIAILQALGKMNQPDLAKAIIINCTHFRPIERRVAESILFQFGQIATPDLLEITLDRKMHDKCRILASKALGRIDIAQLRSHLYDILDIEIDRAAFYYYYYSTIQKEYPEVDLHILEDDLLSSYHSVLDFMIQLLGVAGESADCELLSRALRSPNPKIRSQVIETLEKTCEPKVFAAVYPLIADIPQSEKKQVYLKRGNTSLSLTELLDVMSSSPIQGDQIVAIALKYRLNLPDWRESLKKQLANKDEILHHFAYELLEVVNK